MTTELLARPNVGQTAPVTKHNRSLVYTAANARVTAHGKFFRLAGRKWYVKGFTYGPFAPNHDGEYLPERHRLLRDFKQIRELGGNAIRLYHVPPRWLLDEAFDSGLRVFIDVPWEKHRCFFEDWSAQEDARQRVRKTARLLGNHAGAFAISVANEIPKDIVRYYGYERVGRFVDDLIDIVKQEAPDCLATYTNYPSTEFLTLTRPDFACFNVYLEDPATLGRYLDRLQHVSGNGPLILGEFGIDTIRHGEESQARGLAEHVGKVFRHGLAGSFVFSYTDDWFTGGSQIDDWAFGVTTKQRSPKQAAHVLADVWRKVPRVHEDDLPRVSVVVCSYNGGPTLDECLASLGKLNYPDYEVILVDDGSTDNTEQIVAKYPWVKCIRQSNQGLSVARNVGAQAATGTIVAYTDSDCFADEDWLMYLVQSMVDQKVDGVGGPNIPPGSDSWTAKCVAASPGGPSHVMMDDRRAEHVPGCNMAFHRDKLLQIGGFDARFRAAGDDVDFCWRYMDAGLVIGYAPAALVWHKRRTTIGAFFKQQAGYGKSEAMLHQKHPHRFNQIGAARWKGVIYGEGAVGLPSSQPQVHHGKFGMGLFQLMYRKNDYSIWGYLTLLEWHVLAGFMLLLSLLLPWLAIVPAAMCAASLAAAIRSSRKVTLPRNAPAWVRPVMFFLHLSQPVVRGYHRYKFRFRGKSLPNVAAVDELSETLVRRFSSGRWDMYWKSIHNHGREELLAGLQEEAARTRFEVDFESDWATWDARIIGDLWHNVILHTATEELGWPKRFTRARCTAKMTPLAPIAISAAAMLAGIAAVCGNLWVAAGGMVMLGAILTQISLSRRRVLDGVARLLWRAGHHAKLENVAVADRKAAEVQLRRSAKLAEAAS